MQGHPLLSDLCNMSGPNFLPSSLLPAFFLPLNVAGETEAACAGWCSLYTKSLVLTVSLGSLLEAGRKW